MIEDLRREGLSVKSACDVAEMPKSSYYSHKKQEEKPEKTEKVPSPDDLSVIEKIKSIKNKHPFWGYRRVHAWLNHRDGIKINHKRVYRLMKENQLLVERKSHKVSRKAIHPKPKAERPKEIWGIDMTKFIVEPAGLAYLVIVLDWFTRIKEEAVWINEFESFEEAKEVIGKWVEWYNREYVHSSLGYISPMEYEEEYYSNRRKEVIELRIAA